MGSPVYFSDLKTESGKTIFDKIAILLYRANLRSKVREKDLVALKLHFGEKGNSAYIRPVFIRRVVEEVRKCNGKPFLTDTNTLYVGSRGEAVSHMATAYENGFAYSVVDAPILIADGLRGNSAVNVRIDKPILKTVSIAHGIYMANALISIAHFKGHELSGFGGTLKNLGMGCASREGKLTQHSTISPKVVTKTCKGCGSCLAWCPQRAISLDTAELSNARRRTVAFIHPEKCIGCGECILTCPTGSVQIQWDKDTSLFQKKMVEYAYGVVYQKKKKILFVNFLTQVSPACDCYGFSDTPICGDIGILSSEDPVAIDQASVDLVNKAEPNPASKLPSWLKPGDDKFRTLYPQVDWSVQLAYAEEIGLGTRDYELIPI